MEEVVNEIQPLPAKVHNQYLNAIGKEPLNFNDIFIKGKNLNL